MRPRGIPGALRVAGAAAIAGILFLGPGSHAARPGPPAKPTARPAEVEFVNDSLAVRDRCGSCHTRLLDVDARLAPQPATAHPGRMLEFHPPLRFGCSSCHGDLLGPRRSRAAAARGYGRGRFLYGDATETACGDCHRAETELDGAPHLSRGRALISRSLCAGCHVVGGPGGPALPAPDLAGVAARTRPGWVRAWLRDPRGYAPDAHMPRFELEAPYVDALAAHLGTFGAPADTLAAAFPPGDPVRGKNLFRLSSCISCHSVEGKGGTNAIDLARVGNKLQRSRVLALLTRTHEVAPGTPMPQFHFRAAQVADLAAYLCGELVDPDYDASEAAGTAAGTGRSAARAGDEARAADIGRRAFKELRCGNCHPFPAREPWVRVGPILSRLGAKRTGDIDWRRARFPHTLEDYVWHKLQTPRGLESEPHQLRMPTYGLSPEEARDVTLAILAQAWPAAVPAAFVAPGRDGDTLRLAGEFGRLVARYRCTSCHSVNGVGRRVACDLGREGSRARPKWLRAYLELPYAIRPTLQVRMPDFQLTGAEADSLVEGITRSWRDPGADSCTFAFGDRGTEEAGRRLFEARGCLACHQIGPKGGCAGPSFTSGARVGSRLRGGWMVAWLEDPRRLEPTAAEPRQGFTFGEARAVAAYLATLSGDEPGGAR